MEEGWVLCGALSTAGVALAVWLVCVPDEGLMLDIDMAFPLRELA